MRPRPQRPSPLTVALAVGIVAFFVGRSFDAPLPTADGQAAAAAGPRYLMGTSGPTSTGVTEVYVLDTSTQRLAAYSRAPAGGVQFLGIRQVTWDLMLKEYAPTKPVSVDAVRKALEARGLVPKTKKPKKAK